MPLFLSATDTIVLVGFTDAVQCSYEQEQIDFVGLYGLVFDNGWVNHAPGMRVCSRKRYVFTSTAVLQRVHLPTPERCVERCVENMSFCKAAVYTPYRDTTIGVCTLFSENSVQQPTALHPDASVEPVCPQMMLAVIV
ncbi:unnamed protein product [Haemonchus placei]|uniref:Apple domain-containing protein n=1 Tax=Haemonchus placei TaxID=6290 RepID=A0A0N4WNL0_HAEPC|nr:unnamed protein product [Haemonchus placei]